jgi:hypothetical protein
VCQGKRRPDRVRRMGAPCGAAGRRRDGREDLGGYQLAPRWERPIGMPHGTLAPVPCSDTDRVRRPARDVLNPRSVPCGDNRTGDLRASAARLRFNSSPGPSVWWRGRNAPGSRPPGDVVPREEKGSPPPPTASPTPRAGDSPPCGSRSSARTRPPCPCSAPPYPPSRRRSRPRAPRPPGRRRRRGASPARL